MYVMYVPYVCVNVYYIKILLTIITSIILCTADGTIGQNLYQSILDQQLNFSGSARYM